ncbi:BMP family ABC transporter substrate-binding protein [Marasmitruncus massiliensis]|uniref:BMP family ABC transporter substrate-binding protein n=1 Tax=Marasmitruncus massiliensis TaxID=1944642 RepID=UPI000C7A1EB6|nr:BMP family ABC transporter substrate-binding protein [Marasmitruncus massiliensis]
MKMNKKILAMLLAGAMLFASACTQKEPVTSSSESAASEAASSEAASSEAASGETDDWASKTGAKTFPAIAKEDLKIGFVYVGPADDGGYSMAHDNGRKSMVEALGLGEDQTMIVENVPETSDCETAIRNLIDQGCNVIFTTSLGHMDWTANVAREFPDVIFEHATGSTTGENMSTYFGRMYEERYLSGIVAGMKTKTNKLGYVAAMPVPEVIRGANAFALGAKSVNPDVTVEVKWLNSWYDPAAEKNLAIDLLNSGCDVIGQHCDTTAPQVAAQEKGAFAVGYNASTLDAAPKAYLTSPIWDWGKYYTAEVQKMIDGTWTSAKVWAEASTGIVYLDKLSDNCEPGTQEAVDAAKAKLDSGELKIFAGPLKDNKGVERVPAGSEMTDEEMWTMPWFVENVVGTALE